MTRTIAARLRALAYEVETDGGRDCEMDHMETAGELLSCAEACEALAAGLRDDARRRRRV